MTERIYVRDGDGVLQPTEEQRQPGERYSDMGADPDGARRMRKWSAAENAARAAEEDVRTDPPSVPTAADLARALLTKGVLTQAEIDAEMTGRQR